jgi:hypothetical protein
MLSLLVYSTCAPPLYPFVFPFLTFLINPIYTHVFCLDSSLWKCKYQGLLKTLFCCQHFQ